MFTLRLLGGASLDGPDGPVAGRAALRQRIALLALLAVEHPRPLSRDKLVADLWPENGTDEARHMLRDSLWILRSALGDDSVLGTGDDLRLNPRRLTCDLWEFEAALAREDPEAAVSVYHGPLLSGFHLSDAEEFERWVDLERARLGRRYAQALEQLAEREMFAGEPTKAVEWWSRLAREDPYNSRIALRCMQALEAAGDRAGALRHATAHSDLLRAELGAVPERDVVAFAERLRSESRSGVGGLPATAPPRGVDSSPLDRPIQEQVPAASTSGRPGRRTWALPALVGIAVLGALGVVGGALSREQPPALNSKRVAVPVFANRTGRPELDDLGFMAADWIVRGLMETPVVDVADVEALYADGQMDPMTFARRNGAGLAIRGSYYRAGDSVLFQAGIIDVASGRVLRSLEPVGTSLETPTAVLEVLREDIAVGLGPLVNASHGGWPVAPDLVVPPSFAAYREFVAGLRQGTLGDQAVEVEHLRRAAKLDSTFVAPLVQLAFRATWNDDCALTDSVGGVLQPRKEQLTEWDRLTIDLLLARCRGEMATAVQLLERRALAYPRSLIGLAQYTWALQRSDQPRAARAVLREMGSGHGIGGKDSWYWWYLAASHHMLGEYEAELDITDRWGDSASREWQVVRGRALAGLGREREVMELLRRMAGVSAESNAERQLRIATELWAHGHPGAAAGIAERVLSRVELGVDAGPEQAGNIVWANRLLGRTDGERDALEQIVASDADTLAKLAAAARIAVLLGNTAAAALIDSLLALESHAPLRNPWVRGTQILARAHIATGLGRREEAVALLQEARARGMLDLGSSHAFHHDLLLGPLRGYPPFDALLVPDN
ncbi:MAG TPA: BTAD domain-containing putative transcriptional regulator [Gemmatimonadales bacterium]|nr:BTAD domain-containing putative transcriptional regulator [Gemmatimonadales bacterium]